MRSTIVLVILIAMLGLAVPVLNRLQSRLLQVESGSGAQQTGIAGLDHRVEQARRPDRRAKARSTDTATVPGPVTVYRWRDRSGTLHIESNPPPPGVAAERLDLTPTKEVKASRAREDAPASAPAPVRPLAPRATLPTPMSVYSPSGMEQLLDRLDETIDSMQQRKAIMDELARDL